MPKKDDKDGIIKFLMDRIESIKKIVDNAGITIYEDGEYDTQYSSFCEIDRGDVERLNSQLLEVADICDHTLIDVSF